MNPSESSQPLLADLGNVGNEEHKQSIDRTYSRSINIGDSHIEHSRFGSVNYSSMSTRERVPSTNVERSINQSINEQVDPMSQDRSSSVSSEVPTGIESGSENDPVFDSKLVQQARPILVRGHYLVCYSEHPHTLRWNTAGLKDGIESKCDWCLEGFKGARFSCGKCSYDVCAKCAEMIKPYKDTECPQDFNHLQYNTSYPPEDGKQYVVNNSINQSNNQSNVVNQSINQHFPVDDVAFAFSGGGIRSASFCAGTLKAFIACYAHAPSVISSVSGGGYLASSFLHWQRAHSLTKTVITDWSQHFFDNFQDHIGYFVRDWFIHMPSSTVYGVSDLIYLISRIMAWLITALLIAVPAFFPYAIVVDAWFHSTLLASASGWQLYLVPAILSSAAIICAILYSIILKYAHVKEQASSSILIQWSLSLTWILSVVLLLTSALLLLSHVDIISFIATCSVGFIIVHFVLVSSGNLMLAWILMFIAACLAYWYASILGWFANRHGAMNEHGELIVTDQPLHLFGRFEIHYQTFDRVPIAGTNELYSCTGYGQVIMATMITLAACRDVLLTYRDSIMPLFYRHSLRSAFYYQPAACHCDKKTKQCQVHSKPVWNKVKEFYDKYNSISLLQFFKRDIIMFGTLVALWLFVKRLLHIVVDCFWRGVLGLFCKGALKSKQKAYIWKLWCQYQLTKFHTWTNDRNAHIDGPGTKSGMTSTGVTDWLCVMTLNERTQYQQSEMFNQFVASTKPVENKSDKDKLCVGLPLTNIFNAKTMRDIELERQKSIDVTDVHVRDAILSPNEDVSNEHASQLELTLDDGMAISAAAISFGMGRYSRGFSAIRGVLGLHGLFGLSLAQDVFTQTFESILQKWGLFPTVVHLMHLASQLLLVWYALPSLTNAENSNTKLNIVTSVCTALMIIETFVIACWHTDGVEIVPIFRATRQLIGLPRISLEEDAPSGLLNLSDGGHTENFGILPLLAAQKRLIMLCDGGADPLQQMHDLIDVLTTCREVWGIRFQVLPEGVEHGLFNELYDSWDLKNDILEWAKSPQSDKPKESEDENPSSETVLDESDDPQHDRNQARNHVLRILVRYPKSEKKQQIPGLLLYLKPRSYHNPSHPPLHPSNLLFGCCCNGCNRSECSLFGKLNGSFPHHFTSNQFFTRDTYHWYAEEGAIAFTQAYQWIRLWQHDIHRNKQLHQLNLSHSQPFGLSQNAGSQQDHLEQVALDSLIKSIQICYAIMNRAEEPRDRFVCGMKVIYWSGDEKDREIVHGIFPESTTPGLALPFGEAVSFSFTHFLFYGVPISGVHIEYGKDKQGADVILDIQFTTSSDEVLVRRLELPQIPISVPEVVSRQPKPPRIRSAALSVISFADKSLFRFATKCAFADHNAIQGITFVFADTKEIEKLRAVRERSGSN